MPENVMRLAIYCPC